MWYNQTDNRVRSGGRARLLFKACDLSSPPIHFPSDINTRKVCMPAPCAAPPPPFGPLCACCALSLLSTCRKSHRCAGCACSLLSKGPRARPPFLATPALAGPRFSLESLISAADSVVCAWQKKMSGDDWVATSAAYYPPATGLTASFDPSSARSSSVDDNNSARDNINLLYTKEVGEAGAKKRKRSVLVEMGTDMNHSSLLKGLPHDSAPKMKKKMEEGVSMRAAATFVLGPGIGRMVWGPA